MMSEWKKLFSLFFAFVVSVNSYGQYHNAFDAMGIKGNAQSVIPKGWMEIIPNKDEYSERLKRLPKNKLIIGHRYYEDELIPTNLPKADEIEDTISICASKGEYEPMCFALYFYRGVSKVSARLMSFHQLDGDNKISPKDIDVRVIKYIAVPQGKIERKKYRWISGPFEKLPVFDIPAKRVRYIWVTVYVPKNASAGWYESELIVQANNKKITKRVKIKLRVLPLTLPAPIRPYGLYMEGTPYSGRRNRWLRPDDWDKLFYIWKEYGMNSPAFFPSYANYGGFRLKYVNGKLLANFDECDKLMQKVREAGLSGPVVLNIGSTTISFFEKTSKLTGKPPEALFAKFVKRLIQHAKQANWPELVLAAGEESTVSPKYFLAIKQVEGTTTVCIDNSPWGKGNRMRYWSERWADRIDIYQPNYFSDYTKSVALASTGRKSWYYNLGFTRLSFGLILDKFEAGGYHQWAGEWPDCDPYNRLSSNRHCWMSTYPSSAGPLPTHQLEIAREGIDDSRYLNLLRQLITKAEKTNSKIAHKLADDAKRLIANIFANLPDDSEEFNDNKENIKNYLSIAQQFRKQIAISAIELQNVLQDMPIKENKKSRQTKDIYEKSQQNLPKPVILPSKSFKIPQNCYPDPNNKAKAGMPGFTVINKIDGAKLVWVPSTRDTKGIAIRRGAFLMGSVAEKIERPIHPVELDGFWMYKYEVTVGQWKKFLKATGYKWGKPNSNEQTAGAAKDPITAIYMQDGRSWDWAISLPDDFPIVRVSRIDAQAYAKWAGGQLPTEAQWEWAARGPNGLIWPWGNEWQGERVGFFNGKAPGKLFRVDHFSGDISWCGVVGLASGVREWCCDAYSAYENFYANSPLKNPISGGKWSRPILRGGCSLYGTPKRLRCSGRYYTEWYDVRVELNGFRLVIINK